MDANFYPEQYDLEYLKTYPVDTGADGFEDIKQMFDGCVYARAKISDDGNETILSIATGGWSGCEEMIGALQENRLWWRMYWESTHRGGLFIFKSTKQEDKP